MKLLEDRIRADGIVAPGDVLKVGSFLNQQMDIPFLAEVVREFYRCYRDAGVTKIMTIEASGIGIACLSALDFGVPVVFVKKAKSNNLSGDVYSAVSRSYTKGNTYEAVIPKAYLSAEDRILILDDFLAVGNAMEAMISLVCQAGATLVGVGSLVEKVYQGGGNKLREEGIRVESLAKIASMTDDSLTFMED